MHPLGAILIRCVRRNGKKSFVRDDKIKSMQRTHVFCEEFMKFLFTVRHAHSIARVYNPYNRVCLFEIIPPVRS